MDEGETEVGHGVDDEGPPHAHHEHIPGLRWKPGTIPAWLRETDAENRWPASVAILAAAGLQLLLPERLGLGPRWGLPALELVLLGVLIGVNPVRLTREHPGLRTLSLVLVAVLAVANGGSIVLLVHRIVNGSSLSATQLLASGFNVWFQNVIVFGLWYWELDRGGPAARRAGRHAYADFLFPQMASPGVANEHWEPQFVDYLYLSFTNSTAFSPTDTMPMSRWAKLLMLLQSAVSLVTVALVAARAVNILPGGPS